jgi:hypothetical protein
MTDPYSSDPFRQDRKDPFHEGEAAARARRRRSLGIALALLAFIALIFIVSMIKIAGAHGAV